MFDAETLKRFEVRIGYLEAERTDFLKRRQLYFAKLCEMSIRAYRRVLENSSLSSKTSTKTPENCMK